MKKIITLLLCSTTIMINGNAEGMKNLRKSKNLSTETAMKPIIEQEPNLLNFSSLSSDSDSINSDSSQPNADWQLKTVCTKSSLESIRLQQDIKKAQEELEELQKKYDAQKKANEELLKEANEAQKRAESINDEHNRLSGLIEKTENAFVSCCNDLFKKEKIRQEKIKEKNEKEIVIRIFRGKINAVISQLRKKKYETFLEHSDHMYAIVSKMTQKEDSIEIESGIDDVITSLEEENAQFRQKLNIVG